MTLFQGKTSYHTNSNGYLISISGIRSYLGSVVEFVLLEQLISIRFLISDHQ